MILIGEAIQRVQSIYSRGVESKDSRLSARHIYSCLTTARTTVLQQKANKNQFISQWNYNTISCIELEKAPIHDCICAPKGIQLLRSKFKIPRPVTSLDKALIDSVNTLDGSIRFDYKEYNSAKYTSGRKFTSTKPYYYIRNEYLFIGNLTLLKAIPINGVFHDPIEVHSFPTSCIEDANCVECKCKDIMELEFPIDGNLLNPIVSLASQECIILLKQMSADDVSDAKDNDNGPTGVMVHQPNNSNNDSGQ